tara:strand:+ start:49 stop:249 length:201 start_codon:yes stop_codon:yes gene_type:complete
MDRLKNMKYKNPLDNIFGNPLNQLNNLIDYKPKEYFSNCCGAAPLYNNIEHQRCSDCKENCEFIYE